MGFALGFLAGLGIALLVGHVAFRRYMRHWSRELLRLADERVDAGNTVASMAEVMRAGSVAESTNLHGVRSYLELRAQELGQRGAAIAAGTE